MGYCVFRCYSLHPPPCLLPPPPCVHQSARYICVSVRSLQIGSSVPSFWIPYICINIVCVFLFLTYLAISILPTRKHGISLHLFMSFFISFISILQFSVYSSFVSLGRFIPWYLFCLGMFASMFMRDIGLQFSFFFL